MKKIMVLIVVLSFVLTGNLMSQGLGYGAKGGLNIAKFIGDDASEGDINAKFKFGTTFGGFVTVPLGEKLTARPEVLFTQKGAKYKESDGGYTFKETDKMNWLDIPVLIVYQVNDVINAFAGPYFDIFIGGEWVGSWEGDGDSFDFDETIKGEDVNSFGFGLIFGGAYGVTQNIDVEARIALGLTSWHPDETVKNMGIQVLANYYLKK